MTPPDVLSLDDFNWEASGIPDPRHRESKFDHLRYMQSWPVDHSRYMQSWPAGTVADIPDVELLRRAVGSARSKERMCKPVPRWVAVMDAFGLGSTYAEQLCVRFGFDPEENGDTMIPQIPEPTFKWNKRFLDLAAHVAQWSKDPSTKAGAVIVRPDRTIAAVGFNGFARGCDDEPALYFNRPEKYARIIHCEMNAILSAREPLHGCALYTFPFLTCDRCAVHVIQAGITRVVAPVCSPELLERWGESFKRAFSVYAEAGVTVCEVQP